jgi:hypothetical protein
VVTAETSSQVYCRNPVHGYGWYAIAWGCRQNWHRLALTLIGNVISSSIRQNLISCLCSPTRSGPGFLDWLKKSRPPGMDAMSQLAVRNPTPRAGKRSGTICSAVGTWFDAQKNVSCGQRAAWNCCIIQAIAIHATPASANPSKANKRFRAFLFPWVGLWRLMITALALSATAIRHHGQTLNQNTATLQTC